MVLLDAIKAVEAVRGMEGEFYYRGRKFSQSFREVYDRTREKMKKEREKRKNPFNEDRPSEKQDANSSEA